MNGDQPKADASPARRRPVGRVAIVTTIVVAAAGGAFAVARYASGDADKDTGKATVVGTAGTTIDGRKIDGALHIKADNVRVVNTVVRHKGQHKGHVAIRILEGVKGTVIEGTEVFCEAPSGTGIGLGNYEAKRVKVHGCGVGFQHSAGAPATVADSTWNDKPHQVSYAFVEDGKQRPAALPGLAPGPVTSPLPGGKSWPGPHNTGVPQGTVLSKYTGDFDITKADTVIEGKLIDGCLGIKAKNVTIRRSKIVCKTEHLIIRVYDELPNGASVLIEDSEIDGQTDGLGIGYGHYTLRRVNLHNMNEGARVSDGAVIEDSWIHNLGFTDKRDHQDILQTTGGADMVVRGNTLESFNPCTNDPFNASFMLGSETGPSVTNLLVEGNLLTGGNYTVNIRPDIKAQNVRFRNNVFVRNARYGPAAREDATGVTWESSNVWLDNGKPITER